MRNPLIFIVIVSLVMACTKERTRNASEAMYITAPMVETVKKQLVEKYGETAFFRIDRGVNQVAALWREEDGNTKEFEDFVVANFVADEENLEALFGRLERNFELLNGHFHKMDVMLKEPLHLEGPPVEPVDMLFGSYNPSAHLTDDFFSNKIAFMTALNFPFYSLKEKTEKGAAWSRREWAYASIDRKSVV